MHRACDNQLVAEPQGWRELLWGERVGNAVAVRHPGVPGHNRATVVVEFDPAISGAARVAIGSLSPFTKRPVYGWTSAGSPLESPLADQGATSDAGSANAVAIHVDMPPGAGLQVCLYDLASSNVSPDPADWVFARVHWLTWHEAT